MSAAPRAVRLLIVITALAVLNGATASAWQLTAASQPATDHCRAMRMHQVMQQQCERGAAMSCCREEQEQPESTLPLAAASSTAVSAPVAHISRVPVASVASPLTAGTAWYARPPTHGYSSQSLRLLQSVILI